ncbi:MAG: hypothetical protein L6V86_10140 [Treponema sp.]|nr:MAG: hypothetical protein L6V86_10140 [Treponema sp.]
MNSKERLSQRFEDIGRFLSPDLCALPGTLENISREGCKIHYSFPVSVDMNCDYESKITFSRAANESLALICHPCWVNQKEAALILDFRYFLQQTICVLKNI